MKQIFSFFIVLIFLAVLVNAQADIGIPSGSGEYEAYTSCISGCSLCELRCKDSALKTYAENNNDVSFCAKLSDEDSKAFCTDNINSALAIASKDNAKCALIKDEDLKENCWAVVIRQIAISSADPSKCSELKAKDSCVNAVYRNLAVTKNDASYCEKLPATEQKGCMEELGMEEPLPKQRFKLPFELPKANPKLLLGILGGIIVLAGLITGIYFLAKRKSKPKEAPLLFRQQTQPSQLAKGMKQEQGQTGQQPNKIDLNKLQDALKKVEK